MDSSWQQDAIPKDALVYNRYVIKEILGVGGFGITYKAWDNKLEMYVALKEYYPSKFVNRTPGTCEVTMYSVSNKSLYEYGLQSFINEARNIAKFSSNENIVNVYEFFETNGTAYIAMEYLEGCGLNSYLKKYQLSLDECKKIILSVCKALKAIHKKGIVHRDISPDNIYMCKDGRIKLLDFGAARFAQDENKQLTVILKHGYAPPEQYERVNKQGAWTDIYALGATFYYMLVGKKPEDSRARKDKDITKSPHEINSEIDENLSNVIMRAMAVDRRLRFQSIAELEKALLYEKKVLTVKQVKVKRKLKVYLEIFVAFIAVGIIAGILINKYKDQIDSNGLPGEKITIWYKIPEKDIDAENKESAIKSICDSFKQLYPKVEIDIVSYTENEYEEKLQEAMRTGEGPQLFESTGLSITALSECEDLSELVDEELTDKVLFINDSTKWNGKKLPLGFCVPMIYVDSRINQNYPKTVKSVNDLNADKDYALDTDRANKYPSIYDMNTLDNKNAVEDFYAEEISYLISDSSAFTTVYEELPTRYDLIYFDNENVQASYDCEFSMLSGNDDQNRISHELLKYMLGDKAQDYLHLQNNSHDFPINAEKYNEYLDIYRDFSSINIDLDKLYFE